jgi:hypothetical protein
VISQAGICWRRIRQDLCVILIIGTPARHFMPNFTLFGRNAKTPAHYRRLRAIEYGTRANESKYMLGSVSSCQQEGVKCKAREHENDSKSRQNRDSNAAVFFGGTPPRACQFVSYA